MGLRLHRCLGSLAYYLNLVCALVRPCCLQLQLVQHKRFPRCRLHHLLHQCQRPNTMVGLSNGPSRSVVYFLTSHLELRDVEIGLHYQISKLKRILTDHKWAENIVNLGKVELLSIQSKFADNFRNIVPVTAAATDVSRQLRCSSSVSCVEKDVMNYAFRTAVEAWASMVARSGYMDLSTTSVLIFPIWSHTLRLTNQFHLIRVRFQIGDLVAQTTAALQSIEAISLSILRSHYDLSISTSRVTLYRSRMFRIR